MAQKRRRFAQRRRACGYSQERFAEAVKVDRTTVTRWESGTAEPQPWHRRRIATVLEVAVEELDSLLAEGADAGVGGPPGYVSDGSAVVPALPVAEHAQQHFAATLADTTDLGVRGVGEAGEAVVTDIPHARLSASPDEPTARLTTAGDPRNGRLPPEFEVTDVGRNDGVDDATLREFAMAASDSARFVRRAGVTVSAELLDQLSAEVRALATDYLRLPPYAVFTPISALRREVFTMLDYHVPAQHLSDLYMYAGQLTALLAHASADLGQPVVADAHARTAWLCAELAGHNPLRAYVRWVQANIAYWGGHHQQAAEAVAEGRRHATAGSSLLRLASQEARAWAALGDQQAVERALSTTRDERDHLPDQTNEAGAFYFGAGKAAYYAAEAWLALGGRANAGRAQDDAAEAYALLAAEPQPCPELVAAAQLDLATAQIALGDLENAADTLSEVLALPAERRTVPVTQRAAGVSEALSAPGLTTSPIAAGLTEQISLFRAYPATRELTT